MSTFSHLPKELLLCIGLELDCYSLIQLGLVSTSIYQSFGSSDGLWDLVRTKLQPLTRFNLKAFIPKDLQGWMRISLRNTGSLRDQLRIILQAEEHLEIVSVSLSNTHQLVLSTQGEVYLDHEMNEEKHLTQMTHIDTRTIGPIVAVSNKNGHLPFGSLLLSAQGIVYNLKDNEAFPILATVPIGTIVDISANGILPLLLNSQGQVFALDYLDGDSIQACLIKLDFPVRGIATGNYGSLILDYQGNVFCIPEDLDLIFSGEEIITVDQIDCAIAGEIRAIASESFLIPTESGELPSPWFLNAQGQVYGYGNHGFVLLG